jgi:hypothetical protein
MITRRSSAPNGRLKTLFRHTQTAASMNIDVSSLMGGKSKNITLSISKSIAADN